MFEQVVISIVRQAALLTRPQQDIFTTKVAEALGTLIASSETEIDDEVVRALLPMTEQLVGKLKAVV